ncbi:MAG: c-type cytochrome [Rhizomicrobium sp.]
MKTLLAAMVLLAASGGAHAPATPAQAGGGQRGRYVAILGDCQSCHTAPNGAPFAGGVVLETPFGRMIAPNITPDRTGIGGWRFADFRRALRQGIAPGGRHLYPAMPYPDYARLSAADLAALWAYLKTIKPVHNAIEPDHLRFPFNLRPLMAGWDWLYLKSAPFTPAAGKPAAWNRGAYIVTGPGHCGACHTPKQLLGADRSDALAGGSLEGWFAPDITGAKLRGLGGWSVAEVIAYLKTGWNNHAVATGPMAEVVERSTSQMTDGDLKAIALYLKDQTPKAGMPAAKARDKGAITAGKTLYRDNCVACHGADGKGERMIFPSLAGNPGLMQKSPQSPIRVVLEGAQAVTTSAAPTTPSMPSFAWKLDDAQVADILTYVRNAWSNRAAPVSAEEVAAVRAALKEEP